MPWFKVDDGLHGHPKAIEAGLEAMGLWVLMGSHCGFYVGQRGRVSRQAAARVAGSARVLNRCAERLVRAGLWAVDGDGWAFHEWDVYQPTPEAIEAERHRKAAAGRLGGLARATAQKHSLSTTATANEHESSTTTTPNEHDDDASASRQRRVGDVDATSAVRATARDLSTESKQLLSGCQAEPTGAAVARPVPSRPVPSKRDQDLSPASPLSASTTSRPGRKKPSVPLPESFVVSSAVEATCRAEGLPNPHAVLPDFRDWALGESVCKADWEATFRRWMRDDRTRRRYPAWTTTPAGAVSELGLTSRTPRSDVAEGPAIPMPQHAKDAMAQLFARREPTLDELLAMPASGAATGRR